MGTKQDVHKHQRVVTCAKALVGHVPNQSTTHLLKRAGEVAQRPAKPSLAGFMVNTT